MANYYGVGRTNYFRVLDAEAFKNWLKDFSGLELIERDGLFGLLDMDSDGGGWSITSYDEAIDEHALVDVYDFAVALSEHLGEGQVAVFMEAGHEKHRFLVGWAIAVDWRGNTTDVTLDSIYEQAANAFGVDRRTITEAVY